eukprot:TRINITY_DN7509_c0_g3_i1.p2 TRINITY_DN7509_c0_g3~~TRINITY_DN7509_c0_g3_i1.p2  ORF type:complete len:341 (+),score=83.67 TRINITY_DN7509_c0_g3_i1:88-1110(+)
MSLAAERAVAIEAVVRASHLCTKVFRALVDGQTLQKKDNSPVTVADFGAQAVVVSILRKHFPSIPMIGEEDAKDLRVPEGVTLKNNVVRLVQEVDPELTEEQILDHIDYGTYAGSATGRHWVLDPIDGTKGFLRGEQYAVALGLIENGEVVLGVLGCPNLPINDEDPNSPVGCLYVAVKGEGAFVRSVEGSEGEKPVRVSTASSGAEASFCESVEAAHSDQSLSARLAELLGVTRAPKRMDSQCKYGVVARGGAEIYIRIPTVATRSELVWDHAAGAIVTAEAGGCVTDIDGKPLDFSLGRKLTANRGIIASNGTFHAAIVDAYRRAAAELPQKPASAAH